MRHLIRSMVSAALILTATAPLYQDMINWPIPLQDLRATEITELVMVIEMALISNPNTRPLYLIVQKLLHSYGVF